MDLIFYFVFPNTWQKLFFPTHVVQFKNFLQSLGPKLFNHVTQYFSQSTPRAFVYWKTKKIFKPSHKQNLFQSLKKTHSLIKISFKCTWHKFLKIFQSIFPQITTQFSAPWKNFNTTAKVATPRQKIFSGVRYAH
jgi:hypothetical protein